MAASPTPPPQDVVPLFSKTLLDANGFTGETFDAEAYVDAVANRSLAPGIAPKTGLGATSNANKTVHALTPDVAQRVAQDLVDAASDVVEGLADLRVAAAASVEKATAGCAIAESEEKAKLARLRGKIDGTAATLRDLEGQITSASALTAGVEQALDAASSRVARGRSVLQLVAQFEALIKVPHTEFCEHVSTLHDAWAESRGRIVAEWKRLATVRASQQPVVVGDAFYATTRSADAPSSGGNATEQVAVGHGVPMEFAFRSQIQAGIDLLKKLLPLSTGIGAHGQVANIENVGFMQSWFAKQLILDVAALVAAFSEGYDADAGTGVGAIKAAAGDDEAKPKKPRPKAADASEAGGAAAPTDAAAEADADGKEKAVEGGKAAQRSRFARAARRASAAAKMASAGASDAAGAVADAASEVLDAARHSFDDTDVVDVEFTASWLGRQLLAALNTAATHYAHLTGSTEGIAAYYMSSAIGSLSSIAQTRFTVKRPKPHPPPSEPFRDPTMDSLPATRKTVDAFFTFVLKRVERESVVTAALFGANADQLRLDFIAEVIDKVVRAYVAAVQTGSEAHRVEAIEQQVRLSPRSQSTHLERLIDATQYHLAVFALLYKRAAALGRDLPRAVHPSLFDAPIAGRNSGGHAGAIDSPTTTATGVRMDTAVSFTQTIDDLFSNREEYARSDVEVDLLMNVIRCATEAASSVLKRDAALEGGIADITVAHTELYRRVIDAAKDGVSRARTVCPAASLAGVVGRIATTTIASLTAVVNDELAKTLTTMRGDVANWTKRPVVPKPAPGAPAASSIASYYENPPRNEAHHRSARYVLWAQLVLAALFNFIGCEVAPLFVTYPGLRSEIDLLCAKQLATINSSAQTLVTMACGAVVTRSLAVLMHEQTKTDYLIKDSDSDEMMARDCSRAARLFAKYLSVQLEECRALVASFGVEADEESAADEAVAADAASSAQRPTTPPPQQRGHSRTASLGVGGYPQTARMAALTPRSAQRAAALGLHDVGGQVSAAKLIGLGLAQGIAAHVRQYTMSDPGILVFKRDVTLYRETVEPLIAATRSHREQRLIAARFDTLREVATLLMVPFDHIRDVRSTGLLRYVHPDEIQEYLKMRQDLRHVLKQLE